MSHITGTVQSVSPAKVIGPDSGAGADAGTTNIWSLKFGAA
jgi:hypothetical protein